MFVIKNCLFGLVLDVLWRFVSVDLGKLYLLWFICKGLFQLFKFLQIILNIWRFTYGLCANQKSQVLAIDPSVCLSRVEELHEEFIKFGVVLITKLNFLFLLEIRVKCHCWFERRVVLPFIYRNRFEFSTVVGSP